MGYTVSPVKGFFEGISPKQIYEINRKEAARGNTDAAFELGLAYAQGFGTGQDEQEARHYFELGATTPDKKAVVARMFLTSGWLTCNPDEGVHWFLLAGRSGDIFEASQVYRTTDPPQFAKAIPLYLKLLTMPDRPEYRRAQMELGNLVIDGVYSAGDDAKGRAQNLEFARIITQELLGDEEYKIAVAYSASVGGVPHDESMWLKYCRRAAAYNIDLAQQFYGEALLEDAVRGAYPPTGYAWIKLSSDKQYRNRAVVRDLESRLTASDLTSAQAAFEDLTVTRKQYGAYYPPDDPLRSPTDAALRAMPDDDPDVQLRRAFSIASSREPADYKRSLDAYRIVRNRRKMDVRVRLAEDYIDGVDGVPKDLSLARLWLKQAAAEGSEPAQLLLMKLGR